MEAPFENKYKFSNWLQTNQMPFVVSENMKTTPNMLTQFHKFLLSQLTVVLSILQRDTSLWDKESNEV